MRNPLQQGWNLRLGGMKRRRKIGGDDVEPFLGRRLGDHRACPHLPRIVEGSVEAAKLRSGEFDKFVGVDGIGHVPWQDNSLAVGLDDLAGNRVQLLSPAGTKNHMRAILREQ